VRAQLGRIARRIGVQRVQSPGSVRTGIVERFDRALVEGWVAVPKGAPPVPVTLRVNGTPILSTMAADPARRRRVPGAEVRRFRFLLRDIWNYVGAQDKIRIVAGGQPLPIVGHGTHYRPGTAGELRLPDLVKLLGEGYVFSRSGALQLSRKLDTEWQRLTLLEAARVSEFMQERYGYQTFFIYGTLLGAVREGGPIAHDSDIDLGYVSRHTDGPTVARELREIAFAMIEAGFRVLGFPHHLYIANEIEGHNIHVDLFHTYFDADGVLGFPYGYAGVGEVRREDWKGFRDVPFAGGTGVVPVCAEKIAMKLYGAGWREPQPGFNWNRDRKGQATEARMSKPMAQEVYWADFYEHAAYTSGSTFFDFVNDHEAVPATVLDIGCGDGRDSIAHAKAGRRVIGIDRSHVGIRHASATAAELGFADSLGFRTCDVTDREALSAAVDSVRELVEGAPVLFYLRFFLHSITEDAQDELMSVLDAKAIPGDIFAAEFRTDRDKDSEKVFRRHFRRYQNGPAFGARLAGEYAFELMEEVEGTGLSPFGSEDPYLYRVLARRRP
jgi:SAM-dependent methyltransferase